MKQKSIRIRDVEIGAGRPKICIPIVGRTEEEILEQARKLPGHSADMAEWRADWYEGIRDLGALVRILGRLRDILGDMPLLFTIRTAREGGRLELRAGEYRALNMEAARSGKVDLVDVEMFQQPVSRHEQQPADMALKRPDTEDLVRDLQAEGVRVVGSNHDFAETPEPAAMVGCLNAMQELGADICKLAVMPTDEGDVLALLTATRQMKQLYADRPIITMAMGGMGMISRLSGELSGSAVTFGTAGQSSAPGQIDAERMKEILELLHRGMEAGEEERGSGQHIFLIGFMGTGKSAAAAVLSRLMKRNAIEMDARLEQEEGRKISAIFAEQGEDFFRDRETELLLRIVKEEPAVVSCGGGIVLREENRACMKKYGRVVLLTAEPETVYARISADQDRPVLSGNMNVEYISRLMEKRRELYEGTADVVIATDGKNVEEIGQEIMESLRGLPNRI